MIHEDVACCLLRRRLATTAITFICCVMVVVGARAEDAAITNSAFFPYSAVYVIGDSAVDAGNFNLSPPLPRIDKPAYFRGRFASSYNWADFLTVALTGHFQTASGPFTAPYLKAGATFVPRGTDYAYGGAITAGDAGLLPVPTLARQAAALTQTLRLLDPQALFFISGGGNNFIANERVTAKDRKSDEAVAQGAVDDLAAIVVSLAGSGARRFLINTSNEDSPDPLPGNFSGRLVAALDTLRRSMPALRIAEIDGMKVFRNVADHAAQYGVADPLRSCAVLDLSAGGWALKTYDPRSTAPTGPAEYKRPGICKNVDEHLLIDGLHNTAPVQAALAHAALQAVLALPE